jgi:hypothetical protein
MRIASAYNTLVRLEDETAHCLRQYTAMQHKTALHRQKFMALQHEFVSTEQQGERDTLLGDFLGTGLSQADVELFHTGA